MDPTNGNSRSSNGKQFHQDFFRAMPAVALTPIPSQIPATPTPPYRHPLNRRGYHRRLRDHYFAQAVLIFSSTPHPFPNPHAPTPPLRYPSILSWYHHPASCTLIYSNEWVISNDGFTVLNRTVSVILNTD